MDFSVFCSLTTVRFLSMEHLLYHEIIARFPDQESEDLRQEISHLLVESNIKIIVIDDDPTGIQTVHDCLLLTSWDCENLSNAFLDKAPLFYILTNSRAMNAGQAARVNREAAEAVIRTNREFGFRLIFISRSDSTLRGHFPLEPETIRDTLLKHNFKAGFPLFFIPCFLEAGRYTFENVQFMKEGESLVPVGETEFAGDSVFGYHSSDLRDYITEKSQGRITAGKVGSLPVIDLREKSEDEIANLISSFSQMEFIIVNALGYDDLRKFSLAFLRLFTASQHVAVFRTSSSLPKALSGLGERELFCSADLRLKSGPGLFIVGSHVRKSTRQLQKLLLNREVIGIEVAVAEVQSDPGNCQTKIMKELKEATESGKTPVIYTSREEQRLADHSDRLALGMKISDFLTGIVRKLPFSPAYIVAKGGITSHEIMTRGLCIKRARVLGQILPGVPVVMTGETGRFPRMPYIIFPGNVGDENSLAELYGKMN